MASTKSTKRTAALDIGASEIAKRLDLMGVDTPGTGDTWSTSTVQGILMNECYAGKLVTGKSVKLMHKIINLREEEWIIHENHHEGIVTMEELEKVQATAVGRNRKTGEERSMRSLRA